MKHSFIGDSFETKKIFLFNLMLTEKVKLRALMLSTCVKGSQVKMPPTCLFLKPPVFTYIVLKKYFSAKKIFLQFKY